MTILESDRNFTPLSMIARRGTQSPIIFHNILKGGRDLMCGLNIRFHPRNRR
jgi:hypothetical protein